jgi:hypothetical protein
MEQVGDHNNTFTMEQDIYHCLEAMADSKT